MNRILLRTIGKLNYSLCNHFTPGFKGNPLSRNIADMPSNHSRIGINQMEEYDKLKKRLVWVDLEMTGLEPETCHILEMACLITDEDLNLVAEGPNLIISQSEEVLKGMNSWCQKHHGESGLTEAVRASTVSLQQAEFEMLGFVRQHTAPGYCPIAGNTVHVDKTFLNKYMGQFVNHLHYRIMDVSTVKELCRRWYPEDYANCPQKKAAHRAMGDIQESIKELRYYRSCIFK